MFVHARHFRESSMKQLLQSSFFLGLKAAWPEIAFRQEVLLGVFFSPLPWMIHTTTPEKLLLYGAVFWVLICEIINTAIEQLVNLLQPEFHPVAGAAKDLGSAAVALADFIFLICWVGILFFR